MVKFFEILQVVAINFLIAEGKFSWTNCSPPDSPFKISNVIVSPDPVAVPGDLQLTIEGASIAPLGSAALSLSVKRKSFLGEITIPCLSNIGSCKYGDICTLVDQMITEDWAGIAAGIGTQIKTMLNESGIDSSRCPQPPQELRIENAVIHLPEVPSALSLFAAGDYHARIEITDNTSQNMVLCIDAQVSITESGCSGLACLFGRK